MKKLIALVILMGFNGRLIAEKNYRLCNSTDQDIKVEVAVKQGFITRSLGAYDSEIFTLEDDDDVVSIRVNGKKASVLGDRRYKCGIKGCTIDLSVLSNCWMAVVDRDTGSCSKGLGVTGVAYCPLEDRVHHEGL